MTTKKYNKKITMAEFRAWLQGVEELQPKDWSPNAEQWKLIRSKIDSIALTEKTTPQQGTPVPTQQGTPVGTPLTYAQPRMPYIPPAPEVPGGVPSGVIIPSSPQIPGILSGGPNGSLIAPGSFA